MRRRMAVASRPVPEEHDPRVAQARTRVENAPAVAAGGRYASAERMLRAALGVLERRQRYARAARAAATLGQLLRERGQTARAGAAIQQARLLFDTVETGTPDDPVASLAGGEREDYQAARALLHSPAELPDAGPPPPASRTDAMLEGVAGDLVALVRAVDAASHAEAPPRLCRVLRDRLDAQAVAVYRLDARRRCWRRRATPARCRSRNCRRRPQRAAGRGRASLPHGRSNPPGRVRGRRARHALDSRADAGRPARRHRPRGVHPPRAGLPGARCRNPR